VQGWTVLVAAAAVSTRSVPANREAALPDRTWPVIASYVRDESPQCLRITKYVEVRVS
jgi:hypothetical protein